MRVKGFSWDEDNEEHIARHGVESWEAEEVLFNRPYLRKTREGKYMAYGIADSGRHILVVFAREKTHVRVITARDLTEREKAAVRRRKRR